MENLLRFQTEEGDSESDEDYEGMSPIDTAAVFGDPNSPLLGEPVQIVKMAQDGGFEFDADALSSILLKDNIKDKPVVVVSITGDLRKGKSFMLNHFLWYLHANQQYGQDGPNHEWLTDLDQTLMGFPWRGGVNLSTTGILMWSHPFVVRMDDDQEVAVVLMDTQGAFDSNHTVRESAVVFALSTMISSIQVFNLMRNLQEDNLHVLEVFSEYGRLALELGPAKPFQKLVFLIRDWSFPYDHAYGFAGGAELLKKMLRIEDNMPEQLQHIRQRIFECFNELGCFLMPHPGSNVATNQHFLGAPRDYGRDFLQQLKVFVPGLLKPNKLVVKEIGGRQVTGRELLEYFKVYFNIFSGDTMPEPKTMFEATAEANNLTAVALARDSYVRSMEVFCGGNRPYINQTILDQHHVRKRDQCLLQFDHIPKMGGAHFSEPYRYQLEDELDDLYEHYVAVNESKNMFGCLMTPVILLIIFLFGALGSKVFGIMSLTFVSNIFCTISTISIVVFVFYLLSSYYGNHIEFVMLVDLSCHMFSLYLYNTFI